ncbi:hypothetical protein [Streptomyces sp. NPDC096030]|uniref:hypothetical protein n=1 Tax=Streptomyces sp. NPDC096030 TaxID=3155423 RepID=UPI00332A14E6
MKFRKKIPAIVLGVVSLTAPVIVAGTSAAAPAVEVKAGDSSQSEDTVLTGTTGKPLRALSGQAAPAAG